MKHLLFLAQMALFVASMALAAEAAGEIVITDSGSTNRQGISVVMDDKGQAIAEDRQGKQLVVGLSPELQQKLRRDLEAAGPLDQLAVQHCAKSVSFGSSSYISYNGVRSPDLSCGGQSGTAVSALQDDINDIIAQAHARMPSQPLRHFVPQVH